MPTLASKMVEVNGKQIDVRLLTGTLRIFQDQKKITYHDISSITGLGVNRVSAIMENMRKADGKELKLIADVLIGKSEDVDAVLGALSFVSKNSTAQSLFTKVFTNVFTKVIKFCDKRWDKCNFD